MTRIRWLALVLVRSAPVVLLVAALGWSCGRPLRPNSEAWSDDWARERSELPDADALEGPRARQVCARLLATCRQARERLLPAPDAVLDQPVEDWIERAAGLALNCPGAEGDADGVRKALEALDELEAEIEAALRVDEGSGAPG